MSFNRLILSLDEVENFVSSHNLELVSESHPDFSNEQMLAYVKANIGRVACVPKYYCGNTISCIHIEEVLNGKTVVSFWNIKETNE